MTNQEKLQQAKVANARVRVVTLTEALVGRVLDVDRSDVDMLVGERERRRVHAGHVVSVTIL